MLIKYIPLKECHERKRRETISPHSNTEELAKAYSKLSPEIRSISFRDYCEAKRSEIPRRGREQPNKELKHKANKVTLPNIEG